jgi:hypothetical protein
MRRILPLTLLTLTLVGGVASADHYRRGGGGGVVVRDHRGGGPVARPVVVHQRRAVVRAPVYVSNGRYVFAGGVSHTYVRPVIRQRYFDVRVRPTLVVENYDPVPGYVWVTGRWQWNGYEWIWASGYYAPDTRYRVWYDDGSYEY